MNRCYAPTRLIKIKLRSALVLIALVLGLTAASIKSFAQSTSAVEIVNDSIIVNVGLGEGRVARMLLDTGAETTTFSRAAAQRLGLAATHPNNDNSMFSGIGVFDRVTIGTLAAENVQFGVLKLENDVWEQIRAAHGGVDGSLGLDLLTRFVFGIDMPGATITIWKSGEFGIKQARQWFDYMQVVPNIPRDGAEAAVKACDMPDGAMTHLSPTGLLDIWLPPQASIIIAGHSYRNVTGRSILPDTVDVERRDGALYTIRGELDKYPFAFVFDTGTNRLTLPAGFTSVVKPIVEMPGARLSTVDTTENVKGCIYRSLSLGAFAVQYPYALSSSGQSAYTRRPTLGMGIFSDCKLLIDFPEGRLSVARIAPNADAPRRKLAALGIFLVETEGKQHLYIGKGSPGERAGLHSGDGLIRCDGLPPAQPDAAITVKQIDETKPIAVTVRHYGASEAQTVTFDRNGETEWSEQTPVATFPAIPGGYCGAKRFPNGGVYVDEDSVTKLIRPGGSVLCENGRFSVTYNATRTRTFALNLPKDKFQIYVAKHDPGTPPVAASGSGLLWIGGVGWVLGPVGSRIELDGFTVTLRAVPAHSPHAVSQ